MRTMRGLGVLSLVALQAGAGELQVAPDGLSPHAALETIRAAKAKGDASGWTVKVAPGRYVLKSPLVFTPEDSGSPSAPVRWVAENGTAVFAGGDRLAGWRDEGDGVWSAPVPRDETGKPVWFQSLYVNGRRAVRARHPNAGYFQVDAVEQQTLTNGAGSVSHIQNVTVNDAAADVLTGLSPEELAAVEFQARVKWSYGAFSVTGWDPQTRRLKVCTYDRTVPDWVDWTSEKNLFCFENVRAGFDAPGEWFYDVIRQRICYRPMPGETLARLEAYAPSSGLPGIVRFEGDLEAGRFVTDIAFEGVSFELSTTEGHRLASGFVQQYQGQAARETGGCIYAKGTRRIAFNACRVAHTENYAIRMDKGCVSNRIVRCELTDLGAGGIFIGDVKANYFPREPGTSPRFPKPGVAIPYGDPRTAKFHPCAFIAVDDCTISHAGLVNPEGCGVLITQASDCSVTHCDIYDLYYTGVSVGWTWGYSGSLSQRNTVAFNRIYTIGQDVMSDMGGVYTLGTSFGTCISNNVIYDVRSSDYGGWGLYNDEGSEGVVWENNLVYDVTDAAYHQHYGRDNTVRNNIFVNARKAQLAVSNGEGHRSVTFDRNIVCWDGSSPLFAGPKWSVRVADGKDVVEPVEPARSLAAAKVDWGTNLFWCATGTSALDPLFGGIRADPLFVDLGKVDFRLREGSPARTMGFKPWDFAVSGRRKVPEVQVREGVGHVLAKLEAGKPVTVAYLGGSITEMNGWRNMTTDWLRKAWPQAKVTEVHAAIGGTGSDLGVFRLGHDVLAKNPDLLFVEFATNDSRKPAEEIWRNFDGIVQQTWAKNPKTDIVFVYTITSQMMADYGEGRMNAAARAMERLAAHYGIPSVCFGPRVVAEVRAGRLVMSLGEVPTAVPKETPDRDRLICEELAKKGRTLFAKDGVHPARPGHALYLASVVAAFEAMRALPPADHVRFLGRPFFDGTLAAAKMVPVTAEMLRGTGWTRLGDGDPVQRSFAVRGGQVWRAMRPGDRLRFRFRGRRCAVYDLLGPKGANVRVTVDGKVVRERAPRFDSYCWYTRLATLPVYSGPEGVHEVEIEVLAEQPDRTKVRHEATDTDKYDGTWFQPCQILLVGEMEACQPRAKGWSVATLNGAPGLYRDGKPVAPVLFWQWKIEELDAKAMSRDAGIDLFGVFGSYPHYANPYWKPEGFAGMAYQDENLDQILKWVPSASFLPRLFYSAPDWWIAAHPGERIVYSNFISPDAEARRSGTLVPRESFASERFRRECGPVYRRAVRHLMDRYGEHLLGIHLTSGPCGEHFAWDVLTQYGDIPLKEAGHGDVSEPMTRHFRDWLRTKYANDPARLKTAWRDDSADFENAQVPSRDDRFALDADGVWRDPAKGRRVADYFACQNGTTVDMLDYFAGIVKDESKGALPTLAFYGYTQDEHWAIECDHRAIAAAYRSPNLDMFSAPHTYNRRMPGEDAMMRCYLASAARHGKLYIDEGDDMTFLEHLKPHPDSRCSATNLFESVNILYREFGQAVTHGTGLWYMDLNGNTFRHPALVEAVGRMRRAADLALERDRSHFSQVAVVSNVESEFYMGYRRTEANNMGLFLYQQQMGAFARAGAPFDWYLADDLDAVQERDYRVVVLLDCQYLTERQRKQIESLKKDRRTIISFHAPGYVSETGLSRARMEETAGVRMKPKTVRGVLSAIDVATGREWGCGLTRPADGLEDRPRGTRRRPVGAVQRGLFLPDEGTPLMTGVGDLADVTVAVSKEHGGWTSVFSALPALAPDVLRRIYRNAGVHVYTDADVVLSANAAWLMLHTRAKGRYEVRLPRVCKRVVDVTCDRVVATDADRFAYPMEAFQTGVFLLD